MFGKYQDSNASLVVESAHVQRQLHGDFDDQIYITWRGCNSVNGDRNSSLAEIAIQELGAYASFHQDGNLGIASTPAQRREITVVDRGTADVTASAPSIPSSERGLETSTRPWSAPVGHRQPRAADVPTSTSQRGLDEEDASVDRKINSVCRGC